MIKVVTPTQTYFPHRSDEYWFKDEDAIKVFFAGTIDDGNSENWQDKLIESLLFFKMDKNDDSDIDEDFSLGDLIIYNPRRENWNKNASIKELEKQIRWEQDHLDNADIIIMYLAPYSKSPISLLELGLYGPEGKMLVFCTDKFYRFSNVKLTCEKHNIPLVNTNNIDKICSQLSEIYSEIKNK